MSGPPLRVVVVTFSPGPALPEFLRSLRTATTTPHEVVLADNGSDDGVPEAAVGPDTRLLRTGGNLGYGRAANLGASGFGGDWLVVANPDVVWTPGALDELLAAGRRWPRAGCLGPAIRTPDGRLYPSARAFPSLGRGTGHALFGWWWPANPWTRSYRAETGSPVEGTTGWLSGACMLLRREAFESVAGFDPAYFMYCEDMDLCARLAQAGWLNVYVPSAVVTHLGGHATSRAAGPMLREHHRALYRYLSRQYSGPAWAPVRAVLGVGLLLRYLLAARVRAVGEGAAPTRSAEVLDAPGEGGPP
ncbi:MAG: N-acetylglucosaminyl-diphospho-decaprenol L-rhamnosyltransferase [uncultured Frankineae bacterium]|uniref:N-acetylglucosaminyl-diphospho-decaprenol L-rhamnosyltransferase n=1 Tax=uncultured Frankineae bacterium TaxID=437475 RepID=A0A6J4LHS0_9ACTN|nr:MAG: N-acetylglucosaminyl-diphospho-decaprenol L-rhamnosyltransferase [uncultured Frankineae bacterium]